MRKGITKIIVCLIAISMLSSLVLVGCGKENEEGAKNTIKIGLGGPQTGGSAEHGTRQRRGAELAIEEINAAGGINGKMVELVVMDDRADPKEAANIANRFVSDPEILAVIGHANSSCTLAASPIYNEGKLLHITTSSSAPAITDAGPYTLRLWNSDAQRVGADIEKILQAGYDKNVAIIYENNDYGRGGYEVALKSLRDRGIEPIATESYLLGETMDFTSIITKLKDVGAEAIMAISDETEIAMFLIQCQQLDYHPFFMSTGTVNPAVLRLGGDAVEGATGSALLMVIHEDEKVAAYNKKFVERYNIDVAGDALAPVAYEAMLMILEAIKEVGEDRVAIRDYVAGIQNWDGVFGQVSFDKNGDAFLPLTHVTIKDGKFVPWSPEDHVK